MWYIVVVIVLLAALIYQIVRSGNLKEDLASEKITSSDLGTHLADEIKTASLLRERLTEATDNVASLRVIVDSQNATIKHHEETIEGLAKVVEEKPESTQYPVAPPDVTKSAKPIVIKAADKSTIKRGSNKGPGGRFVRK